MDRVGGSEERRIDLWPAEQGPGVHYSNGTGSTRIGAVPPSGQIEHDLPHSERRRVCGIQVAGSCGHDDVLRRRRGVPVGPEEGLDVVVQIVCELHTLEDRSIVASGDEDDQGWVLRQGIGPGHGLPDVEFQGVDTVVLDLSAAVGENGDSIETRAVADEFFDHRVDDGAIIFRCDIEERLSSRERVANVHDMAEQWRSGDRDGFRGNNEVPYIVLTIEGRTASAHQIADVDRGEAVGGRVAAR